MSEVFWNHLEEQNKEINTNISSFNDSENNLKNSYKKNKKLEWAKDLALSQYTQQQELKEQKEKPILQETKEALDKQAMINEAKTMLYEKLGIDNSIKNNSSFENFEKWIVDTLILDNYDLAIEIYETNWKIILDWLSQLASLEWLKQIVKAIWESIWTIWDWNAYEKWKAVADLWLIWTWIWATAYVWKKTVIFWMKQISKLRINKERLVNSSDLKQVILETNNKVDEIVPKKELDFENLVIKELQKREKVKEFEKSIVDIRKKNIELYNLLPDNIKNIKLDIDYYDNKNKLSWLKKRLWLPNSANTIDIEILSKLKIKEALNYYKEIWKKNLKNITNELKYQLKEKGFSKPNILIQNEVKRLKELKINDEIMIITAFSEKVKLNVSKWWLKSSYQIFDIPFWWAKQYTNLRESVDKWLKIYWLDPKYATMVIEKKDFKFLVENYKFDNYIKHKFEDLKWRAWATYYDSILTWRVKWEWSNNQMIDFDSIIESQALLNIEKQHWIWNLQKIKDNTIKENWFKQKNLKWEKPKNTEMIEDIQHFMEIQIFWEVWKNSIIYNIPK